MRAAKPSATVDEIVDALKTTGKTVTDQRTGLTFKRISMMQAVSKLLGLSTDPPTGSLSINDGAAWAASRNVTLSFNTTNVATMCVSSEANATACAPYAAAAATKAWQLPEGDGPKTVYAFFRSPVGAVVNASDTITLDATPPSGAGLAINGGAASTPSASVTLAINGSDNYPAGLRMCLSNNQTTAAACSPYEAFSATKAWELSAGMGNKTVHLWLKDAAGNTASAHAEIMYLVAPTGTVAINGGAAWTKARNVTLNITAGEGVTGMCVADTDVGAAACTPWAAPAATKPWQLPAGDGAKTVFAYFKNAGGDVSAPKTANITLDATAPSGAALTINNGAASTPSASVTLAINGSDNYPAGLMMCLSNNQTTAAACTPYEAFAATKAWELSSGVGNKTVHLWLKDAAGNTASAHAEIMLLVAPTGTVAINGGAAWTKARDVTLSLTAGEGVTGMCVADTDVGAAACTPWAAPAATKPWQLPAGDGAKTVFAYFKNAGGDVSAPKTANITLDATAPSGAALTINNGAASTPSASVTLAINGSDNYPAGLMMCLSNNQTTAAACTPYEAFSATKTWQIRAGEGSRSVYLWLKDGAGNAAAAAAAATIKIDTLAPSGVTVSINGGDAETPTLNVSVAIAATDYSTVDKMCLKMAAGATCAEADFVPFASPVAVTLPEGAMGARYVYVWLRDARGNTMSAPASDMITYNDPSIPSDVAVSVANANSAGWVTTREVRIAVSGSGASAVTQMCVREDDAPCTDFAPFVNPMPYELTTDTDGDHTLYVTLRGGAPASGTASASSGGVSLSLPMAVDLNPPTNTAVSVNGGAGVTGTPHVSLALAATDISGVSQVCITDAPNATADGCESWRPFSASQSFTLAAEKGQSEVTAFFRDANNHTSAGVTANVTVDVKGPKTKRKELGLEKVATSSSITLTWNKDGATDDLSSVTGFFVLYRPSRRPNNCDKRRRRTKLVNASFGANGTVTATVTGLKPGKRYGFRFCPVDAAGNVGSGEAWRAKTLSANRGN